MLASFIIVLRPLTPLPVEKHVGRWLNGLLYRIVGEANPALATALHDEAGLKPFTVSALQGRMRLLDGVRCAVPEESYQVRYTVLASDLYHAIGQGLLERYIEGNFIELDHTSFEILRFLIPPHHGADMVAQTSFEGLYQSRAVAREITLDFMSPTAFKRDTLHTLFPQPLSVFGGLMRTWNQFAPIALHDGLREFADEQVAVSRYALETKVIRAGKYSLLGFTGKCTYRLPDKGDPELLRQLTLLAEFAYYAGVGMKTTQGMGQVRRLG